MGEDPVILCRDSGGRIRAFLNMCRHRGNRVCRADSGNAKYFVCSFHGWGYTSEGKLVSVPGIKEYYREELDLDRWGLVEVAQLETYKGLIFATFDPATPPLLEYLGGHERHLDLALDRRAGGTEADEEGRAPWFSPAAWLRWLAPAAALAVLVGLLVLPKSGGHSPSYVTYLSHLDEEDAVFTPNSSFTFRSESESMTVVWVQNRWD